MQNIEFKAELRDPELARAVLRRISARRVVLLEQTDTYYRVARGRLKRREAWATGPGGERSPEPIEYIFYSRAEALGPKLSHFTIYTEREAREHFGSGELPVEAVVKKRRELWMHRAVRVHLDDVEGLGGFVEFEALVSRAQNIAKARARNEELRQALSLALGEPIAVGYLELMLGTEATPDPTARRGDRPL